MKVLLSFTLETPHIFFNDFSPNSLFPLGEYILLDVHTKINIFHLASVLCSYFAEPYIHFGRLSNFSHASGEIFDVLIRKVRSVFKSYELFDFRALRKYVD